MNPLLRWILAAVAAAAVLGAGFLVVRGTPEESRFTAQELVAALNEAGARIELREADFFAEGSQEPHAVSFVGGSASAAAGRVDHAHGAATLIVAPDSEAALDTYERCEAAVTLICFRAANVALQVESASAEELARLQTAFLSLGEPG